MNAASALALLLGWFTVGAGNPPGEKIHYAKDYIVVKEQGYVPEKGALHTTANMLLRGGINFGFNFHKPKYPEAHGDPAKDFSRLATSYYHRRSPIGVVMKKLNWFPGPPNTYHADAKTPASLVGLGAMPMPFGNLPASQLVGLWSEPPFAVVTMHLGTMASYARPLQCVDFYEHNGTIIDFSQPKDGKPLFHFIQDAKNRGAEVKIIQGKERTMLAQTGPEKFYHVIVVELCPRNREEDICVELLTKEGMGLLFEKLSKEGILCYHISHRYIDAEPLIADVANSLGYSSRVATDSDTDSKKADAHFMSEWVMVARKAEYLEHLNEPPGYTEKVKKQYPYTINDPYWQKTTPTGKYVWTDKSRHSIKGIFRGDPSVAYIGGFVRIGLKITGRWIPWKAITGREEPPYLPTWRLERIVVAIREQFDPTIEDLQKGYENGK